MISKLELLQGRDKTYSSEYTPQISDNLDDLLVKLNVIRANYGKPMTVTSGFRPASINGMIKGASPKSNHMIGCAADFNDTDGSLFFWCLNNLQLLKEQGIYLEDPRWTRFKGGGWLHMQSIKPNSGKRIFIPNQSLCPCPKFWDGKYDSKYDSK